MAMVNFLDDMVGQVVAALKKKGMWENLLWATNSDNVSICINFAKEFLEDFVFKLEFSRCQEMVNSFIL